MAANVWQHVVAQVPAGWVPDLVPEEVADGEVRLEIRHEVSAEGAYWGKGTRRYRAVWTRGRHRGQGYVEFRPHGSTTTEVVLHLQAPGGLWGRLAWGRERLQKTALGLALKLRHQLDRRAAERAPSRRPALREVRPA